MDWDEVTSLCRIAAGSIAEPTLLDELCGRIATRFGSKGAAIFAYDFSVRRGGVAAMSADCAIPRNEGDELLSGRWQDDHEVYGRIAVSAPLRFSTETALLGVGADNDLPASEVRDLLRSRYGIRTRTTARVNDVGPWLDIMAIYGDEGSKAVDTVGLNRLVAVTAAAATAIQARRTLSKLEADRGTLTEIVNAFDFALAVCASNGGVVLANDRLRDMATARDGVAFTPRGALTAVSIPSALQLAAMLEAAQTTLGAPTASIATMERRSSRRPLVVRVLSLGAQDPDDAQRRLAAVLLLDPEATLPLDGGALAALGMLSPSETEVCDLLIRGLSASEIGEVRDTSRETARTQIKTAAAKLSCNTRLDIIRLAMSVTAPIAHERR